MAFAVRYAIAAQSTIARIVTAVLTVVPIDRAAAADALDSSCVF